jgi:hypothetical protein
MCQNYCFEITKEAKTQRLFSKKLQYMLKCGQTTKLTKSLLLFSPSLRVKSDLHEGCAAVLWATQDNGRWMGTNSTHSSLIPSHAQNRLCGILKDGKWHKSPH